MLFLVFFDMQQFNQTATNFLTWMCQMIYCKMQIFGQITKIK